MAEDPILTATPAEHPTDAITLGVRLDPTAAGPATLGGRGWKAPTVVMLERTGWLIFQGVAVTLDEPAYYKATCHVELGGCGAVRRFPLVPSSEFQRLLDAMPMHRCPVTAAAMAAPAPGGQP
jgi:hypothetical protein